MRASPLALLLLAAPLLPSCGDDSPGRADAGPGGDAATTPTCNTDLMLNVVSDREIREGDYCDDIQSCAASSSVVDTIRSIAPGFDCRAGSGSCEPTETLCVWNTPDDVDRDEYQQLCAISAIEDAPITRCFVYL